MSNTIISTSFSVVDNSGISGTEAVVKVNAQIRPIAGVGSPVSKPAIAEHKDRDFASPTNIRCSVDGEFKRSINEFQQYFEYYSAKLKQNIFVPCKRRANSLDKEGVLLIRHQVVFLLDCTGSMGSIIEATKQEILNFIDILKTASEVEVRKAHAGKATEIIFEVGVVGYRDFGDRGQFEVMDLTTNVDDVRAFLGTIKATGGGDTPEDVQGAFMHALVGIDDKAPRLSWGPKELYASRTMLWLSDAPPHGKQMTNRSDDYSKIDMQEWNTLFRVMKEDKISLTIVKLGELNETAHEVFNQLGTRHQVSVAIRDVSENMKAITSKRPSDAATAATRTYVYLASELSGPVSRSSSDYVHFATGSPSANPAAATTAKPAAWSTTALPTTVVAKSAAPSPTISPSPLPKRASITGVVPVKALGEPEEPGATPVPGVQPKLTAVPAKTVNFASSLSTTSSEKSDYVLVSAADYTVTQPGLIRPEKK